MIARFCSQCGTALAAPPPTRCSACGADHWRNAKPATGAVVLDGTRVLLTRRAHGPWRDGWCVPGGFCDTGEHPIDAAERETLEETGTRIRVTGSLGIWLARYADDQTDADADEISVAYYVAEPLEGNARAADPAEVAEARWFELDALPDPLAPPEILPAILRAAQAAVIAGATSTPLPDRPLGPA